MCQLCGDDNDDMEMRSCMTCDRQACLFCMPVERLCCVRCPAQDDLRHDGEDLGPRCQKCGWMYGAWGRGPSELVSGLRRCPACRLALCEWCSRVDGPQCQTRCPALPEKSRGPKPSNRFRGNDWGHCCPEWQSRLIRKTTYLTAQARLGTSSTAMERILQHLR